VIDSREGAFLPHVEHQMQVKIRVWNIINSTSRNVQYASSTSAQIPFHNLLRASSPITSLIVASAIIAAFPTRWKRPATTAVTNVIPDAQQGPKR
jgi:hypothetical protein